MNAPTSPIVDEFAAAMEWWKGAGVDLDFADDVTDWLEKPVEQKAETPGEDAVQPSVKGQSRSENLQADVQKTARAKVDLFADERPADLAAFHEFWLGAPGLDGIGPRGRVPPRGPKNAKLMVLVVAPEDGDSTALLSGAQGRLLAKMLAAMQLPEDEVYLASALTRPTPMADTAELAQAGMADVLTEHIRLAEPQAVLALGANLLPLLGHEAPQDALFLQKINQKSSPENNHNERSTPLLVSESLESLMASPRLKARFWRRWIEWSANR